MQNNFDNLDKSKLLNLLKNSAGKDGEKIANAVNTGDINSVLGALKDSDREKINNLLNNKEKMQEMLSSKAMSDILKNFKKY